MMAATACIAPTIRCRRRSSRRAKGARWSSATSRALAARSNVVHWTEIERCGHFLAGEAGGLDRRLRRFFARDRLGPCGLGALARTAAHSELVRRLR